MIVVCSTCQARFKVADDKIGPRGAKVRCSKCQTVFVVHRELGVVPAEPPPAAEPSQGPSQASPAGGVDLDLEGAPASGVRPNGFAGNPFARSPAPDPFSAERAPPAAHDPFGAADPFAAPTAPPPAQPDPFAAHDPFAGGGGGFGAVDPFVATVASPAPGLPTSAVTDLSDLLGSAPAPQDAAPAPSPEPEPSGILETGFDFDPSAGGEPGLDLGAPTPPPPPPSPPAHGFDAGAGADLALDERTPAHGMPAAPMPGFGDFAGVDPFEDQGAPSPAAAGSGFASSDFDAFGDDSAPPEPPPAKRAATSREPSSPEIAPSGAAEPAPPVETTSEAVAAAGGFRRTSRARMLAVNAVSLVALLAVVLGMLAIWRGGVRPGAGGLFRPSAVLGAIDDGTSPFATAQVRSGIYERADAPPLLFVTGKAVSRAAAPVAGLRVSVEVVRSGAVVARGEARAGPLPTPEDLQGYRDAASFQATLAPKGAGPPASVKPGDALPFLVAIADFPPDVAGSALRLTVEPAEVAPPAPPPVPAAPPPASPEGAAKP